MYKYCKDFQNLRKACIDNPKVTKEKNIKFFFVN